MIRVGAAAHCQNSLIWELCSGGPARASRSLFNAQMLGNQATGPSALGLCRMPASNLWQNALPTGGSLPVGPLPEQSGGVTTVALKQISLFALCGLCAGDA